MIGYFQAKYLIIGFFVCPQSRRAPKFAAGGDMKFFEKIMSVVIAALVVVIVSPVLVVQGYLLAIEWAGDRF